MNIKDRDNFILTVIGNCIIIIFMLFLCFTANRYKEKNCDNESPTIQILENNLLFYDTENIDYLDYVEVFDNSNEYNVFVVDEAQTKIPGKRQVQIEASDFSGNVSFAYLDVDIISSQEWNEYIADHTNNYKYRRRENEEFEQLKGCANYDAFCLAENFIGMPGACNEVAQAFINSYYGEEYNIFNTEPISKEDALPGDIIYYVDGGLGEQHYAVYLGGSSALQGNIYGTTVIGSVYMTYGSEPQFNRIIKNTSIN